MQKISGRRNGTVLLMLLIVPLFVSLAPANWAGAAGLRAAEQTHQLHLTVEGGVALQATPALAAYPAGSLVTLTVVTPADGVLLGWLVDGQPRGWAASLELRMDADHTVVASGGPRPRFADVPVGSVAHEAITQLAARGIARGYADGRFGSGDTLLRAQAAAFIVRGLGWSAERHENSFPDREGVADDLWGSVATLAHYGVAQGYSDGKFHPHDTTTKVQTISFITRAMVARGYWQPQPDDAALYPNIPATNGHRRDLATYVHYVGAVPDTLPDRTWADWGNPAPRGWFGRAIWQALDSSLGVAVPAPPASASPAPLPLVDVTVTIDRTRPIGTSQLQTGVTHTKEGLGIVGDPAAIARAKNLLGAATSFQNRHIYGWGARNPNPAPGVYDWTDLDAFVASMRSMGVTPVITLAMAPEWMTDAPLPNLTGEPLQHPHYAPTPDHYDDFAELARQVALRYPDVKHYQVWNEMKGFTFPYTEYTTFYNHVYDALKGVDPSIKVGGFYLTLVGNSGDPSAPLGQWELDLLRHWLANAHGADFICLDGAISHFLTPYDGPAPDQAQMLALTHRYQMMTRQVRALTALPIWWSEDYLDPNEGRLAQYASDEYQAAGLASTLYHELLGGAAVSLRWGPIGNPYFPTRGGNANIQSLLSPVDRPGGGQPYPNYHVYRIFHEHFGPGTRLYAATSSAPDLEVLARDDATLLINKRPTAVTVSVNGTRITLAPYEVRLLR